MNTQWIEFIDQIKAHYQKDFVPLHEQPLLVKSWSM